MTKIFIEPRKRIEWVDYGKTMAIFFVVWLHVHSMFQVTVLINGFIMPLFFLISGYLFSIDRNPTYAGFAKKRFRQILFPYLWINVLAYLLWLGILRHYGDDAASATAWYEPLLGFLSGIPRLITHDVPLWSLMCFFTVEIIYYPLRKAGVSNVIVAAAGLGGAFALSYLWPEGGGMLPFALGPSLAGIGFYAIGNWWRGSSLASERATSVLSNPLMLILLCIVFVWITFDNQLVEFYICRYGNFGKFLISSVTGSFFVIGLSMLVARYAGRSRIITFISVGTLLICGFHVLVFAFMKGVALFGFGLLPEQISHGLLKGFLFALTALLLCLPLIYVVNRWLSWLVDKRLGR